MDILTLDVCIFDEIRHSITERHSCGYIREELLHYSASLHFFCHCIYRFFFLDFFFFGFSVDARESSSSRFVFFFFGEGSTSTSPSSSSLLSRVRFLSSLFFFFFDFFFVASTFISSTTSSTSSSTPATAFTFSSFLDFFFFFPFSFVLSSAISVVAFSFLAALLASNFAFFFSSNFARRFASNLAAFFSAFLFSFASFFFFFFFDFASPPPLLSSLSLSSPSLPSSIKFLLSSKLRLITLPSPYFSASPLEGSYVPSLTNGKYRGLLGRPSSRTVCPSTVLVLILPPKL
mmetsp:Transcript_39494/g.82562  ORF Transcript_39494/g.82562 Transcript_39494/m.82562 type:complete len:290 (+) Transcript_39494:142-1011(+)